MTHLEDLEEIQRRLDIEGDMPSVRKAFWRIISHMKRQDPTSLEEPTLHKATQLRKRFFKQPVILSVRSGLFLFLVIAVLSFTAFFWALLFFDAALAQFILLPSWAMILLLNVVLGIITIFIAYGVYPWGRFLGGVIGRIRFEGFYRYSPGELGLKIEYPSYLKTTQSRRKWVFGFPIAWVFTFIFLLMPIAYYLNINGIWAPIAMAFGFGAFYWVIYRMKTGELYRFVRELRIAREVKRSQKI